MTAPQTGLFESLKGFAGTALEIVQTRLELFATELVEERIRLGLLLAYSVAAVILLSLGSILVVTTLAVLFWEQRVIVFVLATAGFLGAGLLSALLAWRQINSRSRLFAASLGELAKDRVALVAARSPSAADPDAR
jgi:uncharacterized membrane protein YqjE